MDGCDEIPGIDTNRGGDCEQNTKTPPGPHEAPPTDPLSCPKISDWSASFLRQFPPFIAAKDAFPACARLKR
jgi:hypothetical protein